MTRATYAPKEKYVGTGTKSDYTFAFKIEALTQLEIIEVDAAGVETQRVRGDDVTYLSSVVFDALKGAGTVNLATNLISGRELILLLANDAPTQPFSFSNKLSFNLKTIERALDFVLGAVQRLAYKSKQALRLHDLDDETTFNTQLPPGIATSVDKVLKVNDAGDGFDFGPASSSLGALPVGGGTGAVVVKNSPADSDTSWDDYILSGFSNRFSIPWVTVGLRAAIDKILDLVYTGPQIDSFTGTLNTLREKGDVVAAITLNATVTKTVDDFARVQFKEGVNNVQDENPPADVDGPLYSAPYSTPFSDNIAFSVEVTDDGTSGGPTTTIANTNYVFVYPYYHGAGVPALSAAAVAALTKTIRTSNANVNENFTTVNGDVYYFAYPASYGALTSILDENSFEVIGDFTLRTENITGLDASAVSYRIYESNNPVLAGTTDFTFIR